MIDSWENIYFNENELPDICKLCNNFVEVFMKVPYYANYNWMMYSQHQSVCDELAEYIQCLCNEKDIVYTQNEGIHY